MTSVNTNLPALSSNDSTRRANASISKSMERLSTGLRITSAADDAAGLAISNRMTSLARGTSVAIRNVMDGISLSQVAEGALGEITNILQRLRELAVQSSTETINDGDRRLLNGEADQLKLEINNIAETTKFNGIKLLDGSLNKLPIQSGANSNETVSLSVNSAHTAVLGTSATKQNDNKVILTFSGGHAAEGENIFVGGVPVKLPTVDITITDEASYWNTKIAETVKDALRDSEQFKNFSISSISNAVVISAEIGTAIPDINLINTENTDINMGVIDANNEQFKSTAYATTLGFTASVYPAGHIINVAGVNVTLTTYTAGADATITSWGDQVAADVKATLEQNEKFSRYIIERDGNTLLAIAPDAEILDLESFDNFGGQNIDMTVNGPTGFVNGVNYGNNTWNNFIGVTRNTSLTFTGGELSSGGYVKIGNTQITLPTFDPSISTSQKYWNDLAAETIRTALDNAAEFDGYYFKRVDNNLLVFAASNIEPVEFSVVNSSNSQIEMKIDEPTQNLATTSSTVQIEQFLKNIKNLERTNQQNEKSLFGIDLLSSNSSRASIATIDAAINAVSSSRAQIGAFLNRLERASENLSEYFTNTSAARSRIIDADYAKETVDLAKNQIISQAAIAMLAQANQSSQSVLSLLKDI